MIDLRLFLAISNLWLFVVSSTRPKLKTFYVKKQPSKELDNMKVLFHGSSLEPIRYEKT